MVKVLKNENELIVLNLPIISINVDKNALASFKEEIKVYKDSMLISIPAINDQFATFKESEKKYDKIKKEIKVKKEVVKSSFGVVSEILGEIDSLEKVAKDCEKKCTEVLQTKIANVSEDVNKEIEILAKELKKHGVECIVEGDISLFVAKEKGNWGAKIYGKHNLAEKIDLFKNEFCTELKSKIDLINNTIMVNVLNYKNYQDFSFDKIIFDYNNPANIDFENIKQNAIIKAQQIMEKQNILKNAEIQQKVEDFPNIIPENGLKLEKYETIKDTTKELKLTFELDGQTYPLIVPVPLDTTFGEVVNATKLTILKLLKGA